MTDLRTTAGAVIAVVGLLMIAAAVVIASWTDEPLPIPLAGVGLVLVAVGLPGHHTGRTSPTQACRTTTTALPRARPASRSARA